MKEYTENLGAEEILYDDKVAKISIVGAGMESHAGVATKCSRLFMTLRSTSR